VGSFSSCERAVLGANAHISRLYEIFVEPAYRIGRRFAATGRFDVSSIILLPGLTVPQALPYQALRQQALRQDRANAPVAYQVWRSSEPYLPRSQCSPLPSWTLTNSGAPVVATRRKSARDARVDEWQVQQSRCAPHSTQLRSHERHPSQITLDECTGADLLTAQQHSMRQVQPNGVAAVVHRATTAPP
jgi:hypothetical protein